MQKSKIITISKMIRCEETEVLKFVDNFIKLTNDAWYEDCDNFYVKCERQLYAAWIFYLLDFEKNEKKRTMDALLDLIETSSGLSLLKLDEIFDSLPFDCLAKQYYFAFKKTNVSASKERKKALSTCVSSCYIRLINCPYIFQFYVSRKGGILNE